MAEEESTIVSTEEAVAVLKGKIADLEVPHFSDDLEGEAAELAQASKDEAMVLYDAQVADLEAKIFLVENPEEAEVAPLSEGGNEDGEPDSDEIAPLSEGGNEYGEEGPPVEEED
jgi:hypothetical protein